MQLSGIRVSILGQFIGYFSYIRYLNLLAIQYKFKYLWFTLYGRILQK
jgi:hypothetical protein